MKTFKDFVNESYKIDPPDGKVLSKMNVAKSSGTSSKSWDLHVVEINDDGDEWVILNGSEARSTTDLDTIWIPKEQFQEFRNMINKIS